MEKIKILIAEDDAAIAAELDEHLVRLGYLIVGVATDSQSALAKVEADLPDFVIMDIQIQGAQDGILAAEIRERFFIPVIYLFRHAEQATLHRARVAEPYGYLFLPLHAQELQVTIDLALDKREMERKLRASETQLNKIQQITQIGHWILDLRTNNLSWSDEIYRICEIDSRKFSSTYDAFLNIIHPNDRELVNREYVSSVEKHSRYSIEYRLLMADGRIKYVNEQGETTYDTHGKPLRSFGIVHDITERKQMENALRESEASYRGLFNSVHDSICVQARDGRFLDVNQGALEMYGYPREWFIGKTLMDLSAPGRNELEKIPEKFEDAFSKSRTQEFEFWGRRATGEIFPMQVRLFKGRYFGREIVIIIARDITKDFKAEEYRNRLAMIIESTSDFVVTTDVNGKALYCNRAARAILGIGENEELSSSDMSVLNPAQIQKYGKLSNTPDVTWLGETILMDRDGNEIPISQVILPHKTSAGEVASLSVIARDITELKKAESAAIKRAVELATVAEISNSASSILDIETLLQVAVELTRKRFGFYHAQIYLLDESGDTLVLVAGAGRVGHMMVKERHMIPLTREPSLVAYAARTRQGVIVNDVSRTTDFLPNPLLPETKSEMSVPLIFGDKVLGVLDVQSDQLGRFSEEDVNIQSTLAAQIATAIQNARHFQELRAVVADLKGVQSAINAGAIVSITDTNGTIEFVNENLLRVSGYTRDELLGKNHRIMNSGYHPKEYFEQMWRTITDGQMWRGEVCNHARDGSMFWLDTTIAPILNDHGKPIKYIAVRFDITERKQVEESLFSRTTELETLFSISAHMRTAGTADEVPPLILEEIQRVFRTDACAFLLLDEENTHFTYKLGTGRLKPNTSRTIELDHSIGMQILQTSRPYMIQDLSSDLQRGLGILGADWIGPAMFAPLQSESETVGMLIVARENRSSRAQAFSAPDLQLLAAIAELVGNALRRIRLYSQALRQLERMQALFNISIATTSSLDLDQILHVLLIEIIGQLEVNAVDVLLFDPITNSLAYRAGRGFRTHLVKKAIPPGTDDYVIRAMLERRTQVAQNLSHDSLFTRKALVVEEGIESFVCVPLVTKGGVIGVLEVFRQAPFNPDKEWMNYLTTVATLAAISMDNANLFKGLQNSNFELSHAYDATIEGWSRALELREHETERHTERVAEMTLRLAKTMGIPDHEIIHVRRGALLHDIGKMGIPDAILLKNTNLTEEEWEIMRMHPQYAYQMLQPIRYLAPALDIPYCHHERWDGTGYPRGLKGEDIPMVARIFAICDVWDAITSDRPYRKAWSKKKAIKFIREQSGQHFDPSLVRAFEDLIEKDK